MREHFVQMGVLVRPHGIRGEIVVDWQAISPFSLDAPLWLQAGRNEPCPARIVALRQHKGRPLIQLEGVNDRTAAERLRGLKLLVRRDDLPELDDDEAYIEDLLGSQILLEDGTPLGRFADVEQSAAHDVWVIATPDGKEVLFPAEPSFIVRFDIPGRTITIAPPPGLVELYLAPDQARDDQASED